ncbi:MAG: hypothetical protein ABIQ60_11420, partial [Burkholderiaceae bacterium]
MAAALSAFSPFSACAGARRCAARGDAAVDAQHRAAVGGLDPDLGAGEPLARLRVQEQRARVEQRESIGA